MSRSNDVTPTPGSTADAILEAATDLLDHAGPDAVTLRAVAERIGLSHNAPYKHFRDKEALLAAVAARELRGLGLRAPGPVRTKTEALAALRRMAHAYARWATRCPHRFKLVFGGWTRPEAALDDAATHARRGFVDLVASAQRLGALGPGDPERLAALLHAVAHGATDLALGGHLARNGKGNADPADLIDDLLDLLAASARAPRRRKSAAVK